MKVFSKDPKDKAMEIEAQQFTTAGEPVPGMQRRQGSGYSVETPAGAVHVSLNDWVLCRVLNPKDAEFEVLSDADFKQLYSEKPAAAPKPAPKPEAKPAKSTTSRFSSKF